MVIPGEIESTLTAYPGFIPGLLVSIVLAGALSRRVGGFLQVDRALGATLVFSVLLIASVTLTPGGNAPRLAGSCDLSRIGPPPLPDILKISEVSLNVLLFVPLGCGLGLLPRSRRKVVLLVAAMVMPVAIELFQLALPALDRACQSADVSDNLTGLLVGLVLGTMAGWAANRRRRGTRLANDQAPQ